MIETSPMQPGANGAPRKPASPGDGGREFGYAMASASLEQGAAKKLEAHGARPQKSASAARETAATAEAKAGTADAKASGETAAKGATAENARNEPPAKPNGSPAPSANPVAAPASAAGAPPVAATTMAANTAGSKPVDALAAREGALARAKSSPAAPARIREPAETVKTEFAEILARRLEKQSQFELRLDPADFGRIEGRLTIHDDGKAVLALKFDNQAAFDFYSRDEAALRQALEQSGLSFANGDFVFAFNDPAGQQNAAAIPATNEQEISAPAPIAFAEPLPLAPFSARALDIRI